MRISDWSSDVCSSDRAPDRHGRPRGNVNKSQQATSLPVVFPEKTHHFSSCVGKTIIFQSPAVSLPPRRVVTPSSACRRRVVPTSSSSRHDIIMMSSSGTVPHPRPTPGSAFCAMSEKKSNLEHYRNIVKRFRVPSRFCLSHDCLTRLRAASCNTFDHTQYYRRDRKSTRLNSSH